MAIDPQRLRDYFAPIEGTFWSWQDEGQTVAWHNGATLAFHGEVLTALRRLAPGGWPPLDAVLLVLAACRGEVAAAPNEWPLGVWAGGIDDLEVRAIVDSTLDALTAVYGLPRDLCRTAHAKAAIVAVALAVGPRAVRAGEAAEMLELFEAGLPEEMLLPRPGGNDALLAGFTAVERGLQGLEAASLERLFRTGLEEPVTAATIDVPPPAPPQDAPQGFEDDPELAPIARLARRLRAVVHLPRTVSQRDDLALGGVSDITNRGPLDRLLISELAHDDLTLAARLATNQALFLRREAPPSNPPRQRLVLLDSGIRLWGVPRVFAAAVGLALAEGAAPWQPVHCWRAAGADIEPIDLATPAGLSTHLAALGAAAHPGAALPAFRRQIELATAASDAVLITAEDAWDDADFQRAIEEAGLPPFYAATVARGGRYRLIRRTARGSQPLQEAILDLADLLAPRPKRPAVISPQQPLPTCLGMGRLPLLVPTVVEPENSWHIPQWGVLTVPGDGRLLHWDHPERGPRELAADLPEGRLHWAAPAPFVGHCFAVVGRLSQRGLHAVRVDPATDDVAACRLELDGEHPLSVSGWRDEVYAVFHDRINACSALSGKLLATRARPPDAQVHGRFVRLGHPASAEWRLLNVVGRNIEFDKFPSSLAPAKGLVTIVDVVGLEGPLGIALDGRVIDFASGKTRYEFARPSVSVRLLAVSRDGARFACLWTLDKAHESTKLVDILRASTSVAVAHPATAVETCLAEYARPRPMRRRFRGICVDAAGQLTLVSHPDNRWPIRLIDSPPALMFPKQPEGGQAHDARAFVPVEPHAHGPALQVAVWPDGSRAYLDGRGLLHLRSADMAVPECSIVLADKGPLAGWCADGTVWGPKYYHGRDREAAVRDVYRRAIRPFIERVR